MSTAITQVEEFQRTRLALFPSLQPGEPPSVSMVKVGRNGIIKAMHTHVALSEDAGQVYVVSGKEQPTVDGYRYLNQARGIKFIDPETLVDDLGRRHPNPWFERDERGTIKRITAKKVGVGRDAVGNFAVYSQTLEFDLHVYLVQDVMARWAGYVDRDGNQKRASRDWGKLYDAERIPAEIQRDGTKKILYTAEGTALVVDLSHTEVQAVIAQHTSRWKFAGRMADSICERRILSKFIPVGKLQKYKDGRYYVPVISWTDCETDFEQWRQVATAAAEGEPIPEVLDAPVTAVHAERGAPTAEEWDGAGDEIEDEGAASSQEPPAPAPDSSSKFDPSELQSKIASHVHRIDHAPAAAIVKSVTGGKFTVGNCIDCKDRDTLVKLEAELAKAVKGQTKRDKAEKTEMF